MELRPGSVRIELGDERPDGRLDLPPDLEARADAFRRGLREAARSRLARQIGDAEPESAPGPEVSPDALGEELFRAVFRDKLYVAYSNWRKLEEPLRLRLRVATELAWIPWELLRDPADDWLALANNLTFVREVYSEARWPAVRVRAGELRVLGVGASPIALPKLDVDHERKELGRALEGAGTLTWIDGDTSKALAAIDRLASETPHVFHFAGHGAFDRASGTGSLYWGTGQSDVVTARKLATLVSKHATIRLVVLNACEGATGGKDADSPSIANVLVKLGAPAVLAMQAPILDSTAVDAARSFYGSLSRGVPVDVAVTELRRMLYVQGREWAVPVLTMARPEAPLFVSGAPEIPPWARWIAAAAAALAILIVGWILWPSTNHGSGQESGSGESGVGGIGSGQADSGVSDSGVSDSGGVDSGVADSGVVDSGVADSGVSDSGVSDSGVSDAGKVTTGGGTGAGGHSTGGGQCFDGSGNRVSCGR